MINLFGKAGMFAVLFLIAGAMADTWHPCIGLNNNNTLVPQGLAFGNNALYVSIWFSGTYVTENDGKTFRYFTDGLPWNSTFDGVVIRAFSVTPSGIFAVVGSADDFLDNGIYRSTNNGKSWDHLRNCRPDYFFTKDTTAYYWQKDTLYGASGAMKTWSVAAPVFPTVMPIVDNIAMEVVADHMFTATACGLFRFTSGDTAWRKLPVPDSICNALALVNTDLFVGTKHGLFHSTNMGDSWEGISGQADFSVLTPMENRLLAGARYVPFDTGGVYVFDYNGTAWNGRRIITQRNGEVRAILVHDTSIYVGAGSRSPDYSEVYSYSKSLSNVTGKWILSFDILPGTDTALALAADGGRLCVSTSQHGPFVSNDRGYTWGRPDKNIYGTRISAFKITGQNILAGGPSGGYISTDGGNTWEWSFLKGKQINWLSQDGTVLYAWVAGATRGELYRSLDNGSHWDSLPFPVCKMPLAVSDRGIFAYGCNDSLSKSTDSGKTWTTVSHPPAGQMRIAATLGAGSKLIVSASQTRDTTGGIYTTGKLFQSSDYGATWKEIIKPGQTLSSIGKLFACGPFVCAMAASTGTYREFFVSADTCASWKAFDRFPGKAVFDCGLIGGELFVATDGGLFHRSLVGMLPVSVQHKTMLAQTNLKFAPAIILKNGMLRIRHDGMETDRPDIAVFNLSGKRLPISFRWTRSSGGTGGLSTAAPLHKGVYVLKILGGNNRQYSAKVLVAR
jgi:hypothetical protein